MDHIDEKRIPRTVDGINVRRRKYYGDTGGPGWYAELQFPIQRRLGLRYQPFWKKQVYVRSTELVIPRFDRTSHKGIIYELFERFGLVSILKISDEILKPIL